MKRVHIHRRKLLLQPVPLAPRDIAHTHPTNLQRLPVISAWPIGWPFRQAVGHKALLPASSEYREGMPNVAVTTALGWPSEEQFQTAVAIVAYCYLDWNDERLARVKRYLEGGGGLVLVHAATWTMSKPSE